MTHKLLTAAAALGATLAVGSPAMARSHHSLRLRMGGHVTVSHRHQRVAMIASPSPTATLVNESYACEVYVPVAGGGARTFWTHASNEFYSAVPGSPTLYSITSTCIGKLPHHMAPHAATSVNLTGCYQFDPLNPSNTIRGVGIAVSYANGLYSETCSVPALAL